MKLGREIRKVYSEGISWPHPGGDGRVEATQSAEIRNLSAVRVVG